MWKRLLAAAGVAAMLLLTVGSQKEATAGDWKWVDTNEDCVGCCYPVIFYCPCYNFIGSKCNDEAG
jgi:hypothetical protein